MQTTRGDATARDALVIYSSVAWSSSDQPDGTTGENRREQLPEEGSIELVLVILKRRLLRLLPQKRPPLQ